jgi:phage protein D
MSETSRLTPVWIVYADGKRLDTEHEGALLGITVNDRLGGAGVFSLVFDTAQTDIRSRGLIGLGSRINIHLGYKDSVEEVFAADVLGFRTKLSSLGSASLEVTGCSELHKLQHGKHSRSFEKKTPADIIKTIAGIYSLKAEVENFGAAQEFSASREETDLELVLRLASFYGKEVYAANACLYTAAEITVRNDEIIYEWGKNLMEFEAEENVRGLESGFTAFGWDTGKSEAFNSRAAPDTIPLRIGGDRHWTAHIPDAGAAWESHSFEPRLTDAEDARLFAAAQLQRSSFRYARARGSGEGNSKLRPGMRVLIKAAGGAYNGEYIADTVRHLFDDSSGYRTDFTLKRNMSP